MREEGEPNIFLCYHRDSEASPQSFHDRIGVFKACGVFLDD